MHEGLSRESPPTLAGSAGVFILHGTLHAWCGEDMTPGRTKNMFFTAGLPLVTFIVGGTYMLSQVCLIVSRATHTSWLILSFHIRSALVLFTTKCLVHLSSIHAVFSIYCNFLPCLCGARRKSPRGLTSFLSIYETITPPPLRQFVSGQVHVKDINRKRSKSIREFNIEEARKPCYLAWVTRVLGFSTFIDW